MITWSASPPNVEFPEFEGLKTSPAIRNRSAKAKVDLYSGAALLPKTDVSVTSVLVGFAPPPVGKALL